jgi:excinuclease ABC subunit A
VKTTNQPTMDVDAIIRVRGARVHNLRNIDIDLPRDRFVVLTGVSGSGKSSLAFDTLFAEGQRRYLQSLSAYTRQFLNQLERPDVDLIDGLPPTISIDQRIGSIGLRSTLATTTEIYDYLRLLYARAGQAHCPQCGRPVAQQSAREIVERILELEDRRKVMILAPIVQGRRGGHRDVFARIAKEGFVRARVDGEIVDAAEPPELAKSKSHTIEAVVDRIVVKGGIRARLQESVDLALKHGDGTCLISEQRDGAWIDRLYSSRFACPDCGISLPALEPRTFSFNSPYGACPECDGLGRDLQEHRSNSSRNSERRVRDAANDRLDQWPICSACQGSRLGPAARAVTLADRAIHEFTAMTVDDAGEFVDALVRQFSSADSSASALSLEGRLAAENALPGIQSRLRYLRKVGLDYLTLDRPTRTLSGGEFQRARLAGCLGSGLIGVCYVLDEPTIGLHPRDTGRLIETLLELRDQGSSVLVVEHDGDVMQRADYLVDLGPGAGADGGRVVAAGTPQEVARIAESLTGRFLSRSAAAAPKRLRRPIDDSRCITLAGARLHNLKDVTVRIPLGVLTCVTGVSGSGKSSLITHTLVPAVRQALARRETQTDERDAESAVGRSFDRLEGIEHIDRIVEVDQSPIGRTGRSNPATYSGIWDEIRRVFAKTREARIRGYTARRFSFNAKEGRCAECAGQGEQRIEMHFLPNMYVTCPVCRGARFNRQTLAVQFRGRTVADILRMRIDAAAEFFENMPRVQPLLSMHTQIGLGYLVLGQSSLTLSGGEAQRIKLAAELGKPAGSHSLFVLDEPTTGLHPADVDRLIVLLGRLIEQGHSVLVIEHHVGLMAAADWIIDLGPGGGDAGGRVIAEGTPEDVSLAEHHHTAAALRTTL